ncbi:HdeD family acid-resistance protein [Roseomonas ludipueritiae]|uniref:HdeD family acid-resistance protein n=2 Tax=Pseudoroseomonas ludipueritiae TaxID=198093 RepID=A0ABR7R510_9PROT|nr:HdeD family acid-resistance protein [Pseudoroseomonas ludipueritiae]
MGRIQSNWIWFLAFGLGLVLLGLVAFANLFVTTLATIFMLGILMLAAGIAHIVLAIRGRNSSRFWVWLVSGLLYAAAGLLVIVNPLLASAVMTLFIALALLVAGVARLCVGLGSSAGREKIWFIASGVLTMLTGLLIATGWPVNSLWVVGLFLAVDLLIQGFAYASFGLALRTTK